MIKQIIKTVLMSFGLTMLCLVLYMLLAHPASFTHYELFMTVFSCTMIVLISMSDWFKVVRTYISKSKNDDPAAVNEKNKDNEKGKKNEGKATNF